MSSILKNNSTKSATNLDRTLFALAGGLPPIIPLVAALDKDKPVEKWEWQEFENSARKDGLRLKHWKRKADEMEKDEDDFSKFNTVIDIPELTEDEWNQYFVTKEEEAPSNPWTKEETQYLLAMCRQFDSRFIVITDRWAFDGPERSIEDIQERYYHVMKTLLTSKGAQEGGAKYKQMLDGGGWDYNAGRDRERRTKLLQLYERTPEQVREEELLYGELIRREAHAARWNPARQNVLKTFNKHGLQTILERIAAQGGLLEPLPKKKKKPRDINTDPLNFAAGSSSIFAGSSLASASSSGSFAALRVPTVQPLISSYVDDAPGQPRRYKNTAPMMLRSGAITPIKQPQVQRVTEFMQSELQLPLPPLMCTAQTMPVYDELRCNVYMLLELRKSLAKTEQEVASLRNKVMSRDGNVSSPISRTGSANVLNLTKRRR